jgi:hypothetical protein
MLCRVDSPITVRYPAEDVRFRLTWDTKILPSCLLWPTDRSITEPPWNGRFRGLGLEPIAAMAVATCVEVIPDRPLVIRYRIEAGDA